MMALDYGLVVARSARLVHSMITWSPHQSRMLVPCILAEGDSKVATARITEASVRLVCLEP
jgi:hypothetical protein